MRMEGARSIIDMLHPPGQTPPASASSRAAKLTRDRLIFGGKVAVSITLLTLLFANLGLQEILEQFQDVNVALLLLVSALPIVQVVVAAFRWRVLLRQQGLAVTFPSLFKIYLMSDFLNLFMPSIVLGDAFRAVRLRRYTQTAGETVPSVVLDRAIGLAALVIVALLGLAALYRPNDLYWIAAALTLIVGLAYLLVIGPVRRRVARENSHPWFGIRRLATQLLEGLRPSWAIAQVAAISFVFQVNVVLIAWLYAMVLGLDVSLTHLLIAIPATTVVELAPISINGIGVREGTLAFLFLQMNLLPEQGFALGATISTMRYLSGLLGGVVFGIDTWKSRSRN